MRDWNYACRGRRPRRPVIEWYPRQTRMIYLRHDEWYMPAAYWGGFAAQSRMYAGERSSPLRTKLKSFRRERPVCRSVKYWSEFKSLFGRGQRILSGLCQKIETHPLARLLIRKSRSFIRQGRVILLRSYIMLPYSDIVLRTVFRANKITLRPKGVISLSQSENITLCVAKNITYPSFLL